ncbi:MAG: hypothetical protein RL174_158 [Actinomycetota bacterium]
MIQWLVAGALWIYLALIQFEPGPTAKKDVDFLPFFESVRTSFAAANSGISPDASALVAGLSIGDDGNLSARTKEAMQTVGLSHLTAVSGANCAIVIAMVYLVLKFFPLSRLWRAVFAASALIFYVLLVGPEPSVLRSALMATVVLFVVATGRSSSAPAALALATLLILVISPKMSLSLGFTLSVSATLGILLLSPPLRLKFSQFMPDWLSVVLAVSLSAQLACWPALLLIQDGVSTYSILANLIAEPLVAPITIIGLIACLVALPFPWLSSALAWLASLFSLPIELQANWLSQLPIATLSWPTSWIGVSLALLVVLLFAIWLRSNSKSKSLLAAIALLTAGAVFAGSNSAQIIRSKTWMSSDWDVVACDVGQGDAMVVRNSGAVALIDVGKDDSAIDECLSNLGIDRIDLLILTHYDMDHIGGLAGALRSRTVGAALVTEFKDDRPAKHYVDGLLTNRGVKTLGAEIGLSGNLGELEWRVLNPRSGALEAEDSNDASTALLFTGRQFKLLALADLGERGQMRLVPQLGTWGVSSAPLILKVSHHGSADQYPELIEALRPEFAIISVGKRNSYGHPTGRTISLLQRVNSKILRTDQLGSIAIDSHLGGGGKVEVKVLYSG